MEWLECFVYINTLVDWILLVLMCSSGPIKHHRFSYFLGVMNTLTTKTINPHDAASVLLIITSYTFSSREEIELNHIEQRTKQIRWETGVPVKWLLTFYLKFSLSIAILGDKLIEKLFSHSSHRLILFSQEESYPGFSNYFQEDCPNNFLYFAMMPN